MGMVFIKMKNTPLYESAGVFLIKIIFKAERSKIWRFLNVEFLTNFLFLSGDFALDTGLFLGLIFFVFH